jgi:HPt (histidine-containing phosphotransfer) domain-containing protein
MWNVTESSSRRSTDRARRTLQKLDGTGAIASLHRPSYASAPTDTLWVSFLSRPTDGPAGRTATAALAACSFELATLVELFDGDHTAITRLLWAARDSIRADVTAISRQANRRMIVEAAHRIRGTSGSIGAQRLIEISSRIEAAMSEPTATGELAAALLDELRTAVGVLSTDIAAYGDWGDSPS